MCFHPERFHQVAAYTLLLPLIMCAATAAGQSPDAYFPLDTGNTWTYYYVLDPPGAPPDTIWRGPYTIAESVALEDTVYYPSAYPFALADTLRNDGAGRIRALIAGEDVVLFDFTREDGEAYHFVDPRAPEIVFQVTTSRDLQVEVAAGRFENCIRLTFDDADVMDEGRTYVFAPGVGILYAYGGHGEYEELYSAQIGHEIITAIEQPAGASAPPKAVAFPNPVGAGAWTTIKLLESGISEQSAVVYDVLGRIVESRLDGECMPDGCTWRWRAEGFPAGLYFVRIRGPESVVAVPITLRR